MGKKLKIALVIGSLYVAYKIVKQLTKEKDKEDNRPISKAESKNAWN